MGKCGWYCNVACARSSCVQETYDGQMNWVVRQTTMIVVDGDGHETVRSHQADDDRLYQTDDERLYRVESKMETAVTRVDYTKSAEPPNPDMFIIAEDQPASAGEGVLQARRWFIVVNLVRQVGHDVHDCGD